MKKLYTLAAVLLMSATTFAQNYDVAITLVTPTAASTQTPGTLSLDFTVTNNGPTTIPTGDTIYVAYVIGTTNYSFGGQANAVSVVPLPFDFASGDQITASQLNGGNPFSIDFSSATNGDAGCVFAAGPNADLATGQDASDADMTNNLSCFQFGTGTASLEESTLETSVYPNPASSVLNIEANEAVKSITIVGLDGQVVAYSVNANEVNVSELTSGLYMYSIETVSGKVATAKFMKK